VKPQGLRVRSGEPPVRQIGHPDYAAPATPPRRPARDPRGYGTLLLVAGWTRKNGELVDVRAYTRSDGTAVIYQVVNDGVETVIERPNNDAAIAYVQMMEQVDTEPKEPR
jgi:hypothetical protein